MPTDTKRKRKEAQPGLALVAEMLRQQQPWSKEFAAQVRQKTPVTFRAPGGGTVSGPRQQVTRAVSSYITHQYGLPEVRRQAGALVPATAAAQPGAALVPARRRATQVQPSAAAQAGYGAGDVYRLDQRLSLLGHMPDEDRIKAFEAFQKEHPRYPVTQAFERARLMVGASGRRVQEATAREAERTLRETERKEKEAQREAERQRTKAISQNKATVEAAVKMRDPQALWRGLEASKQFGTGRPPLHAQYERLWQEGRYPWETPEHMRARATDYEQMLDKAISQKDMAGVQDVLSRSIAELGKRGIQDVPKLQRAFEAVQRGAPLWAPEEAKGLAAEVGRQMVGDFDQPTRSSANGMLFGTMDPDDFSGSTRLPGVVKVEELTWQGLGLPDQRHTDSLAHRKAVESLAGRLQPAYRRFRQFWRNLKGDSLTDLQTQRAFRAAILEAGAGDDLGDEALLSLGEFRELRDWLGAQPAKPEEEEARREAAVTVAQAAAEAEAAPPVPRPEEIAPVAGEKTQPVADQPVEPRNIDLSTRRPYKLPTGEVTTVRSISINEDGLEIIIPTILNGRILTDDQAITQYHRTGEHLGKYRTRAEAVEAAEEIHQAEAKRVHNKSAKPIQPKSTSGVTPPGLALEPKRQPGPVAEERTVASFQASSAQPDVKGRERAASLEAAKALWTNRQEREAGAVSKAKAKRLLGTDPEQLVRDRLTSGGIAPTDADMARGLRRLADAHRKRSPGLAEHIESLAASYETGEHAEEIQTAEDKRQLTAEMGNKGLFRDVGSAFVSEKMPTAWKGR